LSATSAIQGVQVWSFIDDSQTPRWEAVSDTQTPSWEAVPT